MTVEITKVTSGVAFVVAFLKEQYSLHSETAAVGSKIRDPRPARFTKVRSMGGFRPNIAQYAPMINFECWAPDEIAAEQLGSLTEALITSLPDLSPACTSVVEVGGLAYQPDPSSDTPRFTFTKQIYLRSAILV